MSGFGLFNHRVKEQPNDYCYTMAKGYLCENYYFLPSDKIDVHHLYSQGTINRFADRSWDMAHVYVMFRDSFANTFPIEHDDHLAKKPIKVEVEYGLLKAPFPQWTEYEFDKLIKHFSSNLEALTILNYGFFYNGKAFESVPKIINSAILRETLSQVCIDALGYHPEWVKE